MSTENVELSDRGARLRKIAEALGNIGVFTALPVYFGWVRREVQAKARGNDESILKMDTCDYLLVSVRPVLVLMLVAASAVLLWVRMDQLFAKRLRHRGSNDGIYFWTYMLLPVAIIILPSAGWLARE